MSEIEGKLTLVTGSTKGIGKAIAEAFVDHGARVVVHGRDSDEAKQIGQSIGAFSSVQGDLGTAAGCDNAKLLESEASIKGNRGLFPAPGP